MGTSEGDTESKDSRTAQYKSWLYIIGILIFFFLVGFLVKWLSSNSHGLH
jgi:hypothetical protein